MAGMNVQVTATLKGGVAAIGPLAVHGSRHDAHAFEASGRKEILVDIPAAGDLGYVGVDGIDVVPIKRAAKCDLRDCDAEYNTAFSKIPVRRSSEPSPTSKHGA